MQNSGIFGAKNASSQVKGGIACILVQLLEAGYPAAHGENTERPSKKDKSNTPRIVMDHSPKDD
jgi:hypothetical protein